MKPTLKPLAVAVLIATTPLSNAAFTQATNTPAATVQAAPMAPLIAPKPPDDWIIYDDTVFTPVADSISLHLDAARKAFDAKDTKKAAAELRAVADELKKQGARAAKTDKTFAKSEMKLAQETSRRMNAVANKVSATAAGIESGKIKTKADLDKAIDKSAHADMEQRWLVTDVNTWYAVTEEPQQHFISAVEAYTKKDYKAAATEIRKASGYLRLEADRVTGDAKQALDGAVAKLDTLAASVEKGAVNDERLMDKVFANASHALALAHRTEAAESWAHKEYGKAGYEFKAAAQGLENSADWVGGEAKAGAAAVVADTSALGDKLAAGATWTRNEVAKGFESLGNAINTLGHKIDSDKTAAPVNVRTGT